ncbi:MAG: hypothetical protein DRP12_03325 [Candidatus Aenigmatarchaeota archaeon]|nr:MAG: hypothetical protein DRP12_03325 [Candidatus Aenigmarchaeota archaeon]
MDEIRKIPIDKIHLPKREAREFVTEEGLNELADSIDRLGLLNPITVKPDGDGYEIIAGVRRYLACQRLGWDEIPAIVRDLDDLNKLVAMVHENIKREELSEVDQAYLIHELREKGGLTYAEIAKIWGKSETTVRDLHKLVDCDPEILDALRAGHIKKMHALEIMKHPDRERRMWFLQYTIERGASPATLRVMIRDDLGQYEQIKEVIPVQKLTDAKPHLREIKGRCAFCDKMVLVDTLMVIHLCQECYNAFMNARREGVWQAIVGEQEGNE